MRTSLRRPCPQPGCPALQPCPRHARRPWQRATPQRRPGGNGWTWQRIVRRIMERDGYRCRYCGAPATVVDHVLNVARGGSDDDSNLVACCWPCNERKRRDEARQARRCQK